ncbi:MAG: ribonuclease P protein component [Deltaproteobacteria bacterium]|nr:ribonuclease P protein component [Deltaproteobacteria bacterium]
MRENKLVSLKGKNNFFHLLCQKKFFSSYWFDIFFEQFSEGDIFNLGIIVSKRTSRKATVRNYLKRITKEIFRKHVIESVKAGKCVIRFKRLPRESRPELFKKLRDTLISCFRNIQAH